MSRTFRPNSDEFERMAVGPEVRAAVTAEAARAGEIARSLADGFRVTGEYADSFHVSTETTELRTHAGTHRVAAGKLENTSDHAAAVEWGNSHDSKAHHVLSRTLEALEHD